MAFLNLISKFLSYGFGRWGKSLGLLFIECIPVAVETLPHVDDCSSELSLHASIADAGHIFFNLYVMSACR